MRLSGSAVDAVKSTVGAAAGLTVAEGDRVPRFVAWKPSPRATVAPSIAPMDQTATTQPTSLAAG